MKTWRYVLINADAKVTKGHISLGDDSNKEDVRQALRRMFSGKYEITLIKEVR